MTRRPFSRSAPVRPELPDGAWPLLPPRPLAAVPAWLPFVGLVGVFVLASIAAAGLLVVVELAGGSVAAAADPPTGVVIGGTLIQDVALVGAAFALSSAVGVRDLRPASLGLRSFAWGPAVGWIALLYGGFWVFAAVYGALLGSPPEQQLVSDLRAEESLLVLAGFGVLVCLLAPLAEEIFFRGFLFGTLRDRWGVPLAVLVGGTVFGLIHVAGTPIETLGVLVALGFCLCVLSVQTGSIVPGIVVHALNNGLAYAVTTGAGPLAFAGIVAGSVLATLGVSLAVVAWDVRRG